MKKRLTIFALLLVTVLLITGTIAANGVGTVVIADESDDTDVVTVINNATQTIKSVVPVGEGTTGIVAASQPVAPIQFRPGAPIVIELPRTFAGSVTDGTSWPLLLGLTSLTALAVGAAATAWRKKAFGRR